MSSSNQISDQVEVTPSLAPVGTVGATLREAREKAGLSGDELARRLCMTPDKLEALEQDAFERFAGATYVRGYIRNLCKELGLDAVAVMDAFARQVPVEVAVEPVRKPVGAVMASRGKKEGGSLFRPLVLVLAVAAAGGYWWIDQQSGGVSQLVRVDGAQDRDSTGLLASPSSYGAEIDAVDEPVNTDFSAIESVETSEEATDDGAPETDAELAEAEPGDVGTDDFSMAEAPAASVSAPMVVEAEVPAAAAPSAEASAQVSEVVGDQMASDQVDSAVIASRLVISFQEDSWLEVSDATGQKLIAKLQLAGSRVELGGHAPFNLMLGNAAAATVTFNGEVVDSAPLGSRRTRKLTVGG